MKIAEGLILRKHLTAKLDQLRPLKEAGESGVLEIRTERVNINENVDEVRMKIPKVDVADITKEYDYYTSELRKLDVALQKANWEFDLDFKERERK